MARTKVSTSNDESKVVSTERLSYTEWMMKIQSVYYGCDVELDKGIARSMQYNLPNSK